MNLSASGSPIGRATECATLERAVGEALSGRKRAVLIRGAPGLGKTTLLYWSLNLARASGLLGGMTRAPAAGALPPRFPIPELLANVEDACAARSIPVPQLLTETIDALRGERAARPRPPDLLHISQAIAQTARLAPVALIVDDLQWASFQEISLLFAALRLADAPLLLVATARPDSSRQTWFETTADLPADVLDLEGLPIDSLNELAARALGAPALPSVTQALHERTLGNPLFALETLRAWKETNQIGVVAGSYWGFTEGAEQDDSRSLREIISSRLRAIEPRQLSVAQALAVLGRVASIDEIRRIVGMPAESTIGVLSELEDQGMVAHDPSAGHRIAHPLFQASLLSDMNRTRQGDFHGRILGALRDNGLPIPASELAYHAVRALEPPVDLVELVTAAAEEAERAGSYAQAADWHLRLVENARDERSLCQALIGRAAALEHFDPQGAVEAYDGALRLTTSPNERARLLLGRARARRMAGDLPQALHDLRDASDIADPVDLLEIRHAIAVVHGADGRIDIAAELLRALAEESAGTPFHAKAIGHLSAVAYFQGRLDESKELAEEALRECTDPSYAEHLRANLSWVLTALGEWDQAEAMVEANITRARMAHDMWFLAPLLTTAANLYAWRGDLGRAVDLGTEGLRLTVHGNLIDQVTLQGALAGALLEGGETQEAFNVISDVMSVIERAPEKNESHHAMLVLAEIYLARGEFADVQRIIDATRLIIDENLTWKTSLDRITAQLELAKGNTTSALGIAEEYIKKPSLFSFEQAWITEVAAHAWVAAGQKAMALERAATALTEYEGLGAVRRGNRVRRWIGDLQPRPRGRPRSTSVGGLTEREEEILRLVAAGKTNTEIADELVISAGTVKKHIENIKAKVGANRRTQLVEFALRSAPSD